MIIETNALRVCKKVQVRLDQDCINNSTTFSRLKAWDDGISYNTGQTLEIAVDRITIFD